MLAWAARRGVRIVSPTDPRHRSAIVCDQIHARSGDTSDLGFMIRVDEHAGYFRALEENQSGVMVALDPPQVKYVPIPEAIGKMKFVPVDCDTVQTARDLGISFGD